MEFIIPSGTNLWAPVVPRTKLHLWLGLVRHQEQGDCPHPGDILLVSKAGFKCLCIQPSLPHPSVCLCAWGGGGQHQAFSSIVLYLYEMQLFLSLCIYDLVFRNRLLHVAFIWEHTRRASGLLMFTYGATEPSTQPAPYCCWALLLFFVSVCIFVCLSFLDTGSNYSAQAGLTFVSLLLQGTHHHHHHHLQLPGVSLYFIIPSPQPRSHISQAGPESTRWVDDLELLILPPPPLECWDNRQASLCPAPLHTFKQPSLYTFCGFSSRKINHVPPQDNPSCRPGSHPLLHRIPKI